MLKIAFLNLFRHKLRTALCILGIALGIASVIALVSLIDGLSFEIQGAISQMQGITVYQKGAMGPLFSEIDKSYESKLGALPNVKTIIPTKMAMAKNIEGKSISFGFGSTMLIGSDYSKKKINTAAGYGGKIIQGRSINSSDNGKVIVGMELMDKLNKFVGNNLEVNGKKFEIIGIYETGSSLLNSSILMQLDDLIELNDYSNEMVGQYTIELIDPTKDKETSKLINFKFGEKLKAVSASSFSNQLAGILDTLRLLVLIIASIAVLVAGIAILNTMLMSVTERFKEIGTLKATGWSSSDIVKMILMESAMISLIGSITGILLGYAASNSISAAFKVTILITPSLIGQAIFFAIIIGLISGIYPAYVASKLDPVTVLIAE